LTRRGIPAEPEKNGEMKCRSLHGFLEREKAEEYLNENCSLDSDLSSVEKPPFLSVPYHTSRQQEEQKEKPARSQMVMAKMSADGRTDRTVPLDTVMYVD
jgi:hypothetical protein